MDRQRERERKKFIMGMRGKERESLCLSIAYELSSKYKSFAHGLKN